MLTTGETLSLMAQSHKWQQLHLLTNKKQGKRG